MAECLLPGLAQLDLFEQERVDLSRVAVGHVDRYPSLAYALEIARRGAFLMFDNIGDPTPGYEDRVIGLIANLMERGHHGQILISQDICKAHQLRSMGGPGYTYLAETFVPRLRSSGLDDAEIRRLSVDNPKAWLAGASAVGG